MHSDVTIQIGVSTYIWSGATVGQCEDARLKNKRSRVRILHKTTQKKKKKKRNTNFLLSYEQLILLPDGIQLISTKILCRGRVLYCQPLYLIGCSVLRPLLPRTHSHRKSPVSSYCKLRFSSFSVACNTIISVCNLNYLNIKIPNRRSVKMFIVEHIQLSS